MRWLLDLSSRRSLFLWATLFLLPVAASSQVTPLGDNAITVQVRRSVIGRVTMATGESVRDARVEITTNSGTMFRSVATDSQGQFFTEYELSFLPKEFIVTVSVTKKGYPTAHGYANYGASGQPFPIMVVLKQPVQDPSVLSQRELVSGLAPRLRTLGPADGLSAKDVKTYARAAGEFLDRHRLDLAVPSLEHVVASNPSCHRCRVMTALAEMQWGDWTSAENHLAKAANAVIANRQLPLPEPWIAYGVWTDWKRDPDKAIPYFRQAVTIAPKDALALQELGRALCQSMNWEEAEVILKNALAAGAGEEARLLHVKALLWAGTAQDAEAEMNRYVEDLPDKKLSPEARGILEMVQERKKDDLALVKLQQRQSVPYVDYLHNPPPELQHLDPPGKGVELTSILSAVGSNIADLFQKFPNTSSAELVHQEKLDHKGKCAGSIDQKFRYLCLMPSGEWGPQTDEYRADSTGHSASLLGLKDQYMLTSGFVAAPLIFHPAYQMGSTFRLLGRQKVQSREAYLVAFAQDPKRARMYGSFKEEGTSRRTFYQGVAWVDTQNHQILRLCTDLLAPLPAVKLQSERTNIDFGEVRFARIPEQFWLPSVVTVDLDWAGQHLRNRHQYSDFVVFNVDALEKIGKPKGVAANAGEKDSTYRPTP
jgi:Tfp pilus assembly protein PilF